jgi:UDP-N-acetylglucosamine 1-carboxyvinyltransferase
MAEEMLRFRGGRPLRGEVTVQGAKNSALPLLAAALLCSGESILHNVPRLTDTWTACRILNRLGCRCRAAGNTVTVQGGDVGGCEIPDADMRKMRSSIMFLGPLIGLKHACILTMPGGCELGPRPIDMHLDAVRRLGAQITESGGKIHCQAARLRGAKIALSYPSVGVTENVLTVAALAEGETVLTNAAREPEIADLARFLNACGARISGAGEGTVVIEGVSQLHAAEYTVMPDRIAAMTWLCAGAAAGGELCLRGAAPGDMESCLSVLEAAGCRLGVCGDRIYLSHSGVLRCPRRLLTMPYPGFPTDAQAPVTAMLATGSGTCVVEETVFESRYKHVGGLMQMGADIRVSGRIAVVNGVRALHGADVTAPDLRGGAALGIAAAAAEGESLLRGLHHIDRGYEDFAGVFNGLGAEVRRCPILSAGGGKMPAEPQSC